MSVENVKEYLKEFNKDNDVIELHESIATVELAAKALDVSEGEIAKTLAFDKNGECILVVASGDSKIDNAKYKKTFGVKAKMLSAEETLLKTNHPVGGVCPFANPKNTKIYLDESLKKYQFIYPACGSTSTAIRLSLNELEAITKADNWVDVCKPKKDDQLVFVNRKNTNSIKWDIQDQKFGNDDLIPFWVADSDFKTSQAVIDALIARIKQGAFGYSIPGDGYYEAVSGWFERHHGYKVEKEWIVPMCGVVASLHTIIATFVEKNQNISFLTPVYNPFYDVILNNDCNVLKTELLNDNEQYSIDFELLEENIKKSAMFILCSPHNPVGRVWSQEELEKIIDLCKKYDCILVSDEIHCDLTSEPFVSVGKYFADYDKIIICTAPSKTFNIAGLNASNVFIKNSEYLEKYNAYLHKNAISTSNVIGLVATEAAYRYGDYWLEQQKQLILNNYHTTIEFFKKHLPMFTIPKLEGTYLVWINMKCLGKTSKELVDYLTGYGISLNPGAMYGEGYDGYIRLNIACSSEQLQVALDAMERAFKE